MFFSWEFIKAVRNWNLTSHSVSFGIVSIMNELMKGASSQVFGKNIEQLWSVTLALSKDVFFQFFEPGDTVCTSVILKLL